ncbi:DNA adenine methylase [Thalassospira sp. MCCC 1A01428]|uniref:DNA adenine methylase n=1 Tax=Thalassospira sp. MCCC 1A01428 TaxID=1470575 RepID=UPI000A1F183D|nr:DNA adenine methylase [Thalassospira sp. MCCC 1A01428]OSQ45527.1 DNA methyltransferase [Thalassospira sp. MCCC 1A01428]
MSTQIVAPVLPVAPYLGGKRNLAKRLVVMIDQIDHTTYAEPFVGMGGVFLRRIRQPKAEVINDINRELATFYRILQRHYVPFMEMMKFQITTRAEFERLVKTDPTTLTDLERAARFLYLQRTAFGGKVSGRNFGVSVERPGRFDITKLGPMLDDLHSRLSGVVIECLPYGDFITRYDRAETLFYLDPPYFGGENDYGKNVFERADFERLSELLRGLSGRFILSLNDVPEIRQIFAGFSMQAAEVNYSIARQAESRRAFGELIISNT